MTPERVMALPEVPSTLEDLAGHPRFGTYQGELGEVSLDRLRGPYSLPLPFRLAKHKRWTYAQVVTPEVIVVFAIVDITYTSNAFVSVVDLRTQSVAFDAGYLGLPGTRVHVSDRPGPGHDAAFSRPGVKLRMHRPHSGDVHHFDLALKSLVPSAIGSLGVVGDLAKGALERVGLHTESLYATFDLQMADAPPALTVISPVTGDGVVNVTMKRAALSARGTLRIGDRSWSLDGGVGGIDYTHGYLARNTAWRWAMGNGRLADGTGVGFNLVEGFNEGNPRCNENALWLGDRLIPLGRARFQFDPKSPERPWEVVTTDGAVTLRFQPHHVHREERDYKLVRSHFVQPLGVFSGTIRVDGRSIELSGVGGVTEDQDILW